MGRRRRTAPAAAAPSESASRGAAARGGGAPRATNISWAALLHGYQSQHESHGRVGQPAARQGGRDVEIAVRPDDDVADAAEVVEHDFLVRDLVVLDREAAEHL